jgi:hypothetical protein
LGCPPDDIEVHEGDELGKHNFVASLQFRMFQKRLRIMQNVNTEFVAEGLRSCSLAIVMPDDDANLHRTYMVASDLYGI